MLKLFAYLAIMVNLAGQLAAEPQAAGQSLPFAEPETPAFGASASVPAARILLAKGGDYGGAPA